MSAIISFSICLTDIPKDKITTAKNGKKYLNLTASVNDETNDYGQNTSIYVSQSKEEREQKLNRQYLGNGKVVYVNGDVVVAGQQPQPSQVVNPDVTKEQEDDLPF